MRKSITICMMLIMILVTAACAADKRTATGVENNAVMLEKAAAETDKTPEELYKAALEEDILVIYSDTTRIMDVKKSFEKNYPGLIVQVKDIRDNDIINILKESSKESKYMCDIVICTDCNTQLSRELVPEGVLYKYVPQDIADKLKPENNTELLDFLGEGEVLFYNSEVYESPPVTNWWELTEPRFRGKVYIANPLRSYSAFALIGAFIRNSKEMEEAYVSFYGKKLEIPEGSCAGKEFIRLLVRNGLKLTNSSDEVVEAVGTPGQTDPPVGIMISSKERKKDIGFAIEPVFDIKPRPGVYTPNSVMLSGNIKNINTAKLFIRWLLGETNGTGDGIKPYLTKGTWSVRKDVESQSEVKLDDINFWKLDKAYMEKNRMDIEEFWHSLQ